jgi:hypothetical protein
MALVLFFLWYFLYFSCIIFVKRGVIILKYAEAKKDYTIKDCFQITLPEDWNVHYPISLLSHSSDKKSQVSVHVYPSPKKDIDQYMSDLQKNVESSKDIPSQLEESGSLQIDNRKARWSLFSSQHPDGSKHYWLLYRAQSSEYCYNINFNGEYNNSETDRKNINDVISNFKILK